MKSAFISVSVIVDWKDLYWSHIRITWVWWVVNHVQCTYQGISCIFSDPVLGRNNFKRIKSLLPRKWSGFLFWINLTEAKADKEITGRQWSNVAFTTLLKHQTIYIQLSVWRFWNVWGGQWRNIRALLWNWCGITCYTVYTWHFDPRSLLLLKAHRYSIDFCCWVLS